jgi:hypothetical protein
MERPEARAKVPDVFIRSSRQLHRLPLRQDVTSDSQLWGRWKAQSSRNRLRCNACYSYDIIELAALFGFPEKYGSESVCWDRSDEFGVNGERSKLQLAGVVSTLWSVRVGVTFIHQIEPHYVLRSRGDT